MIRCTTHEDYSACPLYTHTTSVFQRRIFKIVNFLPLRRIYTETPRETSTGMRAQVTNAGNRSL